MAGESFAPAYGALAVGWLLLFFAAYAATLVATSPGPLRAAAASPDLADEPPAIVNLLSNRWRLNEDASESTLLDLAARGFLELRQPGNDPAHTTIHLGEPPAGEALLPYERRVWERVTGLAAAGALPVTALTFRNQQRASQWHRRFQHEVINDARARGLSRPRFGKPVVTALVALAAVSAAGAALAAVRAFPDLRVVDGGYLGAFVFLILSILPSGSRGERDTPAGRDAARQWLGLRQWLRGHEQFADLPPAAVTVWDRYLPYGAALGVTHTTSAVLDLGMGDRRRVWSSYGGQWRRVRVRYPIGLRRYGRTAPRLLLRGGLALSVGTFLSWAFGLPEQVGGRAGGGGLPAPPRAATDPVIAKGWEMVGWVGSPLGFALLLAGGYLILRTLVDLATSRTITGEVLWLQVWRSTAQDKNAPSVPWLYYLAVDDGTSERTTAWGMTREWESLVHDRDVVTIRVRPWSRRVTSLGVVTPGRTRTLVDAPVADPDAGSPA